MALLLGICCLTASSYPHPTTRAWLAKSVLAPVFADGMEHALVVIPEEYKENLRSTLVSLRDMLGRSTPDQARDEESEKL